MSAQAQDARERLIERIGRDRYEELQRQAADDWNGVEDGGDVPAWIAGVCVLLLLCIIAAAVWGVAVGGGGV